MVKAIIVDLDQTISDTEQNLPVTITITDLAGTRTYTGKLTAIITHNPLPVIPPVTSVTIAAPGLISE